MATQAKPRPCGRGPDRPEPDGRVARSPAAPRAAAAVLLAAPIAGCPPPPEVPRPPDPAPQCGSLPPASEGMCPFCIPTGGTAHYLVGLPKEHPSAPAAEIPP